MTFRYLGFDQIQSRRVYRFDCQGTGERPFRVVLSVDIALFAAHSVNMQDGPAICVRKLSAAVGPRHARHAELTDDDFRSHAAQQSLAADRRTAAKRRPRQRPPSRRPRSLHSGHWG